MLINILLRMYTYNQNSTKKQSFFANISETKTDR